MIDEQQIVEDALNRYNNSRMLLEFYANKDENFSPKERFKGMMMCLVTISINYFIIHKHINKL